MYHILSENMFAAKRHIVWAYWHVQLTQEQVQVESE